MQLGLVLGITVCIGSLLALTACDRGYEIDPLGQLHPELICDRTSPAEAKLSGACPPCSSLVGASAAVDGGTSTLGPACRDRFYANGWRCNAASASDGGTPIESEELLQCGTNGACVNGYCVFHDRDLNGLDDAFEEEVVERNLPEVRRHPDEHCGGPHTLVYRVQRHPLNLERVAITVAVLYDLDCGMEGHPGDREPFALTVDLNAAPGAAATTGILTRAHVGTVCESTTICQTRAGTTACAMNGADRIVLYSSRDKHSHYFDSGTCGSNCFDVCDDGPDLTTPRLWNAGSPDAPLITDLTGPEGPILGPDGWRASLLHYDPWSTTQQFGGAGKVADVLSQIMAPPGL